MGLDECQVFVTSELGLDVCHGANESRIAQFLSELTFNCPGWWGPFEGCVPFEFPHWLPSMVIVLWILFAIQAVVAVYLMYYFVSRTKYRDKVFFYVHDDKTFKLKSFVMEPMDEDNVFYGCKIFRSPVKDNIVSPKMRIILSFLVLYASFLALVFDFFIDVYFLHGLSTDQLIDVKYIHFDKHALIAMVVFEITAFFCLPLTAFVFTRLTWQRSLRDNLYGEIIIVALAYLLEDGPELTLQYYWVDRYAGMKYKYPDGTEFTGRATILLSSIASLTVAVVGIINLISLYQEFLFWLKFKALTRFLTLHKEEWEQWPDEDLRTKIPMILDWLQEKALREGMVERIKNDMKEINQLHLNLAFKKLMPNAPKDDKKYFDNFVEAFNKESATMIEEKRNQSEVSDAETIKSLEEIQRKTRSAFTNNLVILLMTIFGLIPLLVNLFRLSAAVHQVFKWRMYKKECLKLVGDPETNKVTVDQRGIHKTDCWGFFEWPFFVLNAIGLVIHLSLLVFLVVRVFINRNSDEGDEHFEVDTDESENKDNQDDNGEQKVSPPNSDITDSPRDEEYKKLYVDLKNESEDLNNEEKNSTACDTVVVQ